MQFRLSDGREFEIPDEWLSEAGMIGFKPSSSAFLPAMLDTGPTAGLPVELVEVGQVMPPQRQPGVTGLHRDRTVRILSGFVSDAAIEPVLVHPMQGAFAFRLAEGFHRFHSSVAAGFTHLPVCITPAWD